MSEEPSIWNPEPNGGYWTEKVEEPVLPTKIAFAVVALGLPLIIANIFVHAWVVEEAILLFMGLLAVLVPVTLISKKLIRNYRILKLQERKE